MKKMPEKERLETVQLLETNKKEIEFAIQKLPLTIETPSMIKHEKNLRKQLKETENAIKIFSKKNCLHCRQTNGFVTKNIDGLCVQWTLCTIIVI